MKNQKIISNDIQVVESLGDLVQAYEQIYVGKMQKVRQNVLGTRYYMEGLGKIYGELKRAYVREQAEKQQRRTLLGRKLGTTIKTNGKTAAVLLSASQKLSGDINQKIFYEFLAYIKEHPDTEVIIIGTSGRYLYQQMVKDHKFIFFDVAEDTLSMEKLQPVIEYLVPYTQVKIFYGKFVNFVNQKQIMTDLKGNVEVTTSEQTGDDTQQPQVVQYFIFEPSLEELLKFFETQIFVSLYKQTAHESHLAQVGSRINALELANINIEKKLKELQREKLKLLKRKRNKKQLQSLVGMSLWKR